MQRKYTESGGRQSENELKDERAYRNNKKKTTTEDEVKSGDRRRGGE